MFSVYSGYFLVGGYFNRYQLSRKVERGIVVAGLFSAIVMAFGRPVGFFHNFTTLFAALYTFTILIAIHKVNWANVNPRLCSMILFFSSQSMGVYVLHSLLIRIINRVWEFHKGIWPLQIVCTISMTILVCACITTVMKKIKFINKLV